jgi:hypothetical protein
MEDGYQFMAGEGSELYFDLVAYSASDGSDVYYTCKQSHTKSSANEPGTEGGSAYWQMEANLAFIVSKLILSKYICVENLGASAIEMKDDDGNTVLKAKDGNVECNSGTFRNVKVEGDISSVNGNTKVTVSAGREGMAVYHVDDDGVEELRTTFTAADNTDDKVFEDGTDYTVEIARSTGNGYVNYISRTGSGNFYGNNQSAGGKGYDLMTGMKQQTFIVNAPSRVDIYCTAGKNLPVADMDFSLMDNDMETTWAYGQLKITITGTTTGEVYSDSVQLFYNYGDQEAQVVEWSGCSLQLQKDTYTISIESALRYTSDSDSAQCSFYSQLYGMTVSIDPSAYRSSFFGNGFAFGTSSLQHFQSRNITDSSGVKTQCTECVSGDAGFSVEGGVLMFRIGGAWYKVSLNSAKTAIVLTEQK